MSAESFISPLRIEQMSITEVNVKVSQERPVGEGQLTLTLDTQKVPLEQVEQGGIQIYRVVVPLTVSADLTGKGDSGSGHFEARLGGRIAVTLPVVAYDGPDPLQQLRANGVSILYAQMRAELASAASSTWLKDFYLPPIDPFKFLQSVDENEGQDLKE